MLRFVRLSGLIILTGLFFGAACGGKGQLPGTGGAGGGSAGIDGMSGAAGATSAAGTGGSAAGAGGAAGAQGGIGGTASGGMSGAGGAPLTSCPTSIPAGGMAACSGSFVCRLNDFCNCHGCCYAIFNCDNGIFKQQDYNDGCIQGPACTDGGAGSSGGAGKGGAGGTGGGGGTGSAGVCTAGADQSCNDNPAISSIHGHCTDAGVCECGTFGTNPDSGRCL